MWRKRLFGVVAIVLLALGAMTGTAHATGGDRTGANVGADMSGISHVDTNGTSGLPHVANARDVATQTSKNTLAINMVWLMVGGVLVLFMQAGFALVETGFTQAKNASHTMMMNLVIFALGVMGWYICGYAFMFGSTAQSVIGLHALGTSWHVGHWNLLAHSGFFLGGNAYDVSVLGFFFFQLVFMDATATIPTGAMAERWKFSSFCVWGLFASMILYPVYGNWVWGGGWLSQLGVLGPKLGHGAVDFAGSGVVHAMGGVAAFWGAKILGPRIGKFDRDGKPRAIPGHHIPMAMLGTFVLLVGWMGFNGASTFAGSDLRFTVVIVNTILASATGCLACMFVMWRVFGKPDPSMTANGLLAGLVAITAPCAFVAPWAACVIGAVAGLLVVGVVVFVERVLKIDDPVGAVAVHGANGLWGLLAVGLFADGTYGNGLNGVDGFVKGLFYGDAGQLGAQLVNMITLIVWCSVASVVFFTILKNTVGMRSKEEHEIAGLDLPEMGALAYPDFLEAQGPVFAPIGNASVATSAKALREEVAG
ncbi:MAG: ammonium transporter, Amt family [Actinomycetota bacterium]|jgi:Amt family ammonium transporter